MNAEEAFNRSESRLMSIPGVVGVGMSESGGRPVISIMVNALTPELRSRLPANVEGVPTRIDVVGDVSAF
jgi:hypothetical protein